MANHTTTKYHSLELELGKDMEKALQSKKPSAQQIVSLTNSELKIKDLSDKKAETKTFKC